VSRLTVGVELERPIATHRNVDVFLPMSHVRRKSGSDRTAGAYEPDYRRCGT
jgi:hypothetical protein